jgi:hypothetical protein
MKSPKKFINSVLKNRGYEIRSIEGAPPSLPQWIRDSEPEPNTDAVINGKWEYTVLQMANRNYSPPNLGLIRTQYGEDCRIKYVANTLDLRDQRVLELGSHEGHWSVLIEKMGVRENVGIESRQTNFEKCLRVKDKYGLSQTAFHQLNIEDLYEGKIDPPFPGGFDLVFCLGLLYHLPDPAKAVEWFLTQSDTLFLGTQYVEKEAIRLYQSRDSRFQDGVLKYQGQSYSGKWYSEYGLEDHFSGMSPRSFWLYEEDLIRLLRSCGYQQVDILGKDYQNNMPHITLLARRGDAP